MEYCSSISDRTWNSALQFNLDWTNTWVRWCPRDLKHWSLACSDGEWVQFVTCSKTDEWGLILEHCVEAHFGAFCSQNKQDKSLCIFSSLFLSQTTIVTRSCTVNCYITHALLLCVFWSRLAYGWSHVMWCGLSLGIGLAEHDMTWQMAYHIWYMIYDIWYMIYDMISTFLVPSCKCLLMGFILGLPQFSEVARENTEETYSLINNVSFMKFPDGGFSLVLWKCRHDAFFYVNCLNVEPGFGKRPFITFQMYMMMYLSLLLSRLKMEICFKWSQ